MKSKTITLLCSIFLLLSTFFTHRWNVAYNSVISFDAAGYYLYLPAFFYDDPGKIHQRDYIIQKYNPFGADFDDINSTANGNYILKYTCGIALLELPAFGLAHVWARSSHYPVDGFSLPYQVCINFWSIMFGIAGIWILRKLLLRYFSDSAVSLTIFTLCVATNLYNFISFSGSMSHAYLFTVYACILYITVVFYERPSYLKAIILGLLSGLAVLIRPTEIVLLILIFSWGIMDKKSFFNRLQWLWQQRVKIITWAIGACLIGSIQLVYWKYFSGHWVYWSYGKEEGFTFLHPHIFDGLFSYRKGWFMYTPVMLLLIPGFIILFKTRKIIASSIFIYFLLTVYLVFSWKEWWYGGSFSQRSVVQSYAVLAFPLCSLFDWLKENKKFFIGTGFFIAGCCYLNGVMTYQSYSQKGIMENNIMSRKYYWKIFGRLNIDPSDKKYIELRDEIPSKLEEKLQPVYQTDFEQDAFSDTCFSRSGHKGLFLSESRQFSPEIVVPVKSRRGYYRATIYTYPYDMEWNLWNQTQWVISLCEGDKEIRSGFYRLYHIVEPGRWQKISIDIKTPKENFDRLKLKFWNANSNKQIQFDDLSIEFAMPE